MNESELMHKIQLHLITDITPTNTTNKYEYYDCYSATYDCKIELKCRYTEYNDYMIEKSKYDKLIKSKRCRYINSVKDEKVYSWNLKKIPTPDWKMMWLPSTTEFDNNELKLKEVGFLPLEQAKDISFILYNSPN